MTITNKEEWIRRRALKLWTQEGRDPAKEQACWDKAVDEFELASSEDDRGPVHPDPVVGSGSDPTRR